MVSEHTRFAIASEVDVGFVQSSWPYEHEAALSKGARQARVTAAEAVETARAHAPDWTAAAEAQAMEIINWWAGIHYWQVRFRDEGNQAAYTTAVDAQSGEILSWGSDRDLDAPVGVSVEDAETTARAYLAVTRHRSITRMGA